MRQLNFKIPFKFRSFGDNKKKKEKKKYVKIV